MIAFLYSKRNVDDLTAGTNYVADGYKVVSETKENGDIWYTVVPQ